MLSNYIGEPIILDLMATWCVPCKTQIEHLQVIKDAYPNVHIISVSVDLGDTIPVLSAYKADNNMDWVVGRDISTKGASNFQATAIPTMAFFSSEGIWKHWEQGVTTSDKLSSWINED
jgi:thiol-disulfide isomerase/thioredoxin